MPTSRRVVSTQQLLTMVNPLDGSVWGCAEIAVDEINEALSTGVSSLEPYNVVKDGEEPEGGWRAYHIARIAELARSEIDDKCPDYPITISVATAPDEVTIEEGRHRVIAAFVRGQEFLNVSVIEVEDGDFDRLFALA